MPKTVKIDFVSDVTCPWCAVGLGSLEQALVHLSDEVDAQLHFQPFELNPHMTVQGQDATEHLSEKYGSTESQQAQIRQAICQRGAQVGFSFNPEGRGRIWNTFNAHRLLHLAGMQANNGLQRKLKWELLAACHTRSDCMSDSAVLSQCAERAGLDMHRVKQVLESDELTDEVRNRQAYYHSNGIHSVPAMIINDEHLMVGGQAVDTYIQALRKIANMGS